MKSTMSLKILNSTEALMMSARTVKAFAKEERRSHTTLGLKQLSRKAWSLQVHHIWISLFVMTLYTSSLAQRQEIQIQPQAKGDSSKTLPQDCNASGVPDKTVYLPSLLQHGEAQSQPQDQAEEEDTPVTEGHDALGVTGNEAMSPPAYPKIMRPSFGLCSNPSPSSMLSQRRRRS
jgi:hypothetical protein